MSKILTLATTFLLMTGSFSFAGVVREDAKPEGLRLVINCTEDNNTADMYFEYDDGDSKHIVIPGTAAGGDFFPKLELGDDDDYCVSNDEMMYLKP